MVGVCLDHDKNEMAEFEIFSVKGKESPELLPWTSGEQTSSYPGKYLAQYPGNLFLRA